MHLLPPHGFLAKVAMLAEAIFGEWRMRLLLPHECLATHVSFHSESSCFFAAFGLISEEVDSYSGPLTHDCSNSFIPANQRKNAPVLTILPASLRKGCTGLRETQTVSDSHQGSVCRELSSKGCLTAVPSILMNTVYVQQPESSDPPPRPPIHAPITTATHKILQQPASVHVALTQRPLPCRAISRLFLPRPTYDNVPLDACMGNTGEESGVSRRGPEGAGRLLREIRRARIHPRRGDFEGGQDAEQHGRECAGLRSDSRLETLSQE